MLMRAVLPFALLLAAGCGTGTDGQSDAQPTTPVPTPTTPTPTPTPPVQDTCTNERQRAEDYEDAILPFEWDGRPFRVDLFDHFPSAAGDGYLDGQLAEVRRLANQIEGHIGYPVIRAGGVVRTPRSRPEGWNPPPDYGAQYCIEWRRPGQVVGVHLAGDDYPPAPGGGRYQGGGAISASPWCAVVNYWLARGPTRGPNATLAKTSIVHELFHLFGFKDHNDRTQAADRGIFMSQQLTTGRGGDRARYPTAEDLDALRCVFPRGR